MVKIAVAQTPGICYESCLEDKYLKKRKTLPAIGEHTYLIDSHCHLEMAPYQDDLDSVIERARSNKIMGIITIGTNLPSSLAAVQIAQKYPMVKATVGVHPHDAGSVSAGQLDTIAELARKNPTLVVGYGEIGLDYAKQYAPPAIQRQCFTQQLELAKSLNLPVVIHDRDAHADCLDIIRAAGPLEAGGVMHCFSGNLEFALQLIAMNFKISIPGIVTFKNATELQEVAAQIPLDSMLIETDGPFLAPVPYRGKRNEPVYTLYIAEFIAKLRNIPVDTVAMQTAENTMVLFRTGFD